MKVSVGQPAPDFSLTDQHGTDWTLSAHRGAPVILYFYPRDSSPGCTSQACDVRENWSAFEQRGVEVVGISPDDEKSHAKFADEHGLPQTLLADPDHKVLETYGAWGEKTRFGKTSMGVIRSSVVVDADGRVTAVFDNIKPAEQSERTLAALEDLAV